MKAHITHVSGSGRVIRSEGNVPAQKPTMNLYHWSSKLLKQYGEGDIIVMAETVEEARDKALAHYDPLNGESPTYDAYLEILHLSGDEDYSDEYNSKLDTFKADLANEPNLLTYGMIFIRGSQ